MHNTDFQLHPQLAADCIEVCDLPLSKILLMNDSQYPWFVQVPRLNDVCEVIDLNECQQNQLWYESRVLSELIRDEFCPHKLNVAALGNMVPQLHIHHIARYTSDPAWPKPVWGLSPAKSYDKEKEQTLTQRMQTLLKEKLC